VKLRLGLAAFVSFAVQNPGHYRVLFDGVADLDGRAETDSLDAFERFVDTSYSPEPSDRVTRRHVTTALVALAHGYIQLALSGRRDARAAGHQALEVLDALCVGPLAIRGDSLEMEYVGLLCRHPGLGRTFAS